MKKESSIAEKENFSDVNELDPEKEFIENITKSDKKIYKLKKLLLVGWKRDLKKVWFLFALIAQVVFVLGVASFLFGDFFGWRMDIFLKKMEYKEYNHVAPDFNFKYPNYFEIDNGERKNYGENYVTGFKLNTDTRTGCDVRFNKAGINFKKNDQEITDALSKEISRNAKEFNLISAKRIKISGEDAFSLEFSFIDPTNNRIRLEQIMTGHDGNYYIFICGTGDYQYRFFQKDFKFFFDSFDWKSKI